VTPVGLCSIFMLFMSGLQTGESNVGLIMTVAMSIAVLLLLIIIVGVVVVVVCVRKRRKMRSGEACFSGAILQLDVDLFVNVYQVGSTTIITFILHNQTQKLYLIGTFRSPTRRLLIRVVNYKSIVRNALPCLMQLINRMRLCILWPLSIFQMRH